MTAALELTGHAAAPGFAAGALVPIGTVVAAPRRTAQSAEAERMALDHAIAASLRDLAALQTGLDDADAAEILAFQIEMLEDPALSEPALARIIAGHPADAAWAAALGEQVADYEKAADDYFRARAVDLRDLCDRVLRHLGVIPAPPPGPAGAILVGEDLTPSRFLEIDWSGGGGIALAAGSPISHVAMLARAAGVPMVVGLGPIPMAGHAEAALDGTAGRLVLSPGAQERERMAALAAGGQAAREQSARTALQPAITADGERVRIMLNVSDPAELAHLDPAICDGIGVVRTEMMFYTAGAPPTEDQQYRMYCRILDWAAGRPVTIRTLDMGGDKPVAGLTFDGESNPFLGLRGIRLTLLRPQVFTAQLRALARAAVHGDLKVMLPMVTVPREVEESRRMFAAAVADLTARGVACRMPPLGMMVEVPAAALTIERFDAAFFSIGTNDLTQYVTASARDIDAVSELADPANPAVLRLIAEVARHGAATGREVSVCGDMAGDPAHAAALLAAGIDCLSMAPNAVGAVKAAIAGLRRSA